MNLLTSIDKTLYLIKKYIELISENETIYVTYEESKNNCQERPSRICCSQFNIATVRLFGVVRGFYLITVLFSANLIQGDIGVIRF